MKNSLKYITIFILLFCIPIFFAGSASYGQEDEPAETVSGDWLTFRGNPEHTGKTSLEGPPEEIEMKWRWRMNYYDRKGPISASPAVTSDGTVYIATEGGYLAAINPEGGPGWTHNVSDPIKSSPSVDSSGNVLAVTEDGYMYYIDSSGELQWKCDLDIDIVSSPVISGGTAYVGTDDKTLLAISLTPEMSGIETESRKILKSDVVEWFFQADGTIKSSPAFSGNTVFFGGGSYLYAINPTAGGGDNTTSGVKWKFDVHAEILSSPAVHNGSVYVGADDGYLYVFNENVSGDTQQGELLWKRKTGDSIRSSPAIDDRDGDITIYVGSDDGKLYAIDEVGELQWTYSALGPIRSSPAVDGSGDIYFGSDDGYIYALFSDGSLKWKFKTSDMVRSSPAIGPGNRLYAGSNNGYLYCIGESTKEKRELDMKISVSLSLSAIENNGNPTTISASITSESESQNVLSRISSVKIDLMPLNLTGFKSDTFGEGDISQENMLDDGKFEDDVTGDGTFTYAFGITNDTTLVDFDNSTGIFTHYIEEDSLGIGPVPLMITVSDLYGNRVSEPFALNIVHKMSGAPPFTYSINNKLGRQTLNISFTSGTPSILSILPDSGSPGDRIVVVIMGINTNFTKNRTSVEIFNEAGFRIAHALSENDDVEVLSDTSLSAKLNIVNTDEVTEGGITGQWDITVTTEFAAGGVEIVVGEDLFEISGTSARVAVPAREFNDGFEALQTACEFTLDITNEIGARPNGSPWKINTGYGREMTIEDAQSGKWNFNVTIGDCVPVPSFKIITTGSNFGYLVGEVRNGFTGQGIDNATITALTGMGVNSEPNSTVTSGGGYYLLPLSAAEDSYTVIAHKTGMIDIEREIEIEANVDDPVELNFSLRPELKCPLSELVRGSSARPLYLFRDSVLMQTPEGKRWVMLYYKHAREVQRIVLTCPEFREKSREFVLSAVKAVPAIMEGGKTDRNLHGDVQTLIDILIGKASPELKIFLGTERENILVFLKKFEMK